MMKSSVVSGKPFMILSQPACLGKRSPVSYDEYVCCNIPILLANSVWFGHASNLAAASLFAHWGIFDGSDFVFGMKQVSEIIGRS